MTATDDEPVRAVYVILTHAGWKQVQRLAAAILRSSPRSRVLIAHDARAEQFPAFVDDPRIVVYTHGLPSDWGSWELVEATLRAFSRARELFDPALVTLITGADYPARSLAEWEREAVSAEGWVGTASPLEYTPRWGRARGVGDDRLTRYTMRWYRPFWSGWVTSAPRWWVRLRWAAALRLEPAFGVRDVTRGRGIHYGIARAPACFSPERPCYFGGQTLAVRRVELDRLLDEDFAPGSPLRRVYRRTMIPDESALQTALAWRSAPAQLPPVSYMRWDETVDQCVVWTATDFDEIRASRSPFCRKVDPERSDELLSLLDELI
ncbi:hypothetical protein [Agromyces bauzanensis]|uniref:Core-2/I-Branching enzyme n=1 Tax=Agromyces bauzanensis TaxID=1308924 RepID=A0A917PSZ3_9MICO|nr:hypothetical protein [Agromyces bauzanensis]GGJ90483.1 hypothetical protein GCM10011372_31280 [Agromyces bauzanensis]